ncbi:hypothetical protein [Candidatus Tisiphia endosymbiont of Hybos culiciformis]|uniref:hypothetical protein n=1 Tax=Candidatus Tisiphia endosymbiont of Hybos culiciformis TaxID=3139331 RepID=UPI003CCAB3A9
MTFKSHRENSLASLQGATIMVATKPIQEPGLLRPLRGLAMTPEISRTYSG